MNSMNRFSEKDYGIPDKGKLIELLKDMDKKVTVVLFGTAYAIPLVQKADTILVAYEDSKAAHQAVADVILGKKVATGILPVKIK